VSRWLLVQPETIPPRLRALPWVLWRAEPQAGGKPRKVPYRVADPTIPASSTDPATWGTFGDAVDAYSVLVDSPADPRRGPIGGIGVVRTAGARISCIDLDRVITDGALPQRHRPAHLRPRKSA
jgi:primase-polymerase (primpol)-like protein